MAGYGKDSKPLFTQTTAAKSDYIDARRSRMRWSRSEMGIEIINFWFAMGAPALAETEVGGKLLHIPKEAEEPVRPYWDRFIQPAIRSEEPSSSSRSPVDQEISEQRKKRDAEVVQPAPPPTSPRTLPNPHARVKGRGKG